jgi:hypothetical protein
MTSVLAQTTPFGVTETDLRENVERDEKYRRRWVVVDSQKSSSTRLHPGLRLTLSQRDQ